jgi:hypothetical protein
VSTSSPDKNKAEGLKMTTWRGTACLGGFHGQQNLCILNVRMRQYHLEEGVQNLIEQNAALYSCTGASSPRGCSSPCTSNPMSYNQPSDQALIQARNLLISGGVFNQHIVRTSAEPGEKT